MTDRHNGTPPRSAPAAMTLTDTAAAYRASLVAQLYDEWCGFYILQRLNDGRWQDVRPLTRAEAETIRLSEDESLLIAFGLPPV